MQQYFLLYRSHFGRLAVAFVALLLFTFAFAPATFAVSIPDIFFVENLDDDPTGAINSIAQEVITVLAFIILAVSVIMILWGAFNYLMAGANEDKVAYARNVIMYALIGVAVSVLAYALPTLVINLLRQVGS